MRALSVALGAAFALLLGASPVLGGWSLPRPLASPGATGPLAIAVDGSGDTALAWETLPPPPNAFGTSIHVVVRLADGRASSRTLWKSNDAFPAGVSVVLGHGEITVAWVAETRRERMADAGATVRAAYGTLTGRWSAPRAVGHWHDQQPPAARYPRLAVAPSGEVLLVFDDNSAGIDGPVAAWRAPGHPFRAPRRLLGRRGIHLWVPGELGPIRSLRRSGGRLRVRQV